MISSNADFLFKLLDVEGFLNESIFDPLPLASGFPEVSFGAVFKGFITGNL